jgi:hypothetical protein
MACETPLGFSTEPSPHGRGQGERTYDDPGYDLRRAQAEPHHGESLTLGYDEERLRRSLVAELCNGEGATGIASVRLPHPCGSARRRQFAPVKQQFVPLSKMDIQRQSLQNVDSSISTGKATDTGRTKLAKKRTTRQSSKSCGAEAMLVKRAYASTLSSSIVRFR